MPAHGAPCREVRPRFEPDLSPARSTPCAQEIHSCLRFRKCIASRTNLNGKFFLNLENRMAALRDLLTTDYGLMSAAVIGFMLLMALFFVQFVRRHIAEEERRIGR
ncbi:MAG TPA: DUF3149 domain-containing protein [Burkholderiaceae bacterium]|nr:DUF3149 domain-containing protein [Burkholderiaceae bacterium]